MGYPYPATPGVCLHLCVCVSIPPSSPSFCCSLYNYIPPSWSIYVSLDPTPPPHSPSLPVCVCLPACMSLSVVVIHIHTGLINSVRDFTQRLMELHMELPWRHNWGHNHPTRVCHIISVSISPLVVLAYINAQSVVSLLSAGGV